LSRGKGGGKRMRKVQDGASVVGQMFWRQLNVEFHGIMAGVKERFEGPLELSNK
jgi:hypothetical protein